MTQVCSPLVPTYSGLLSLFPPTITTFPAMISLPSPQWVGVVSPPMNAEALVTEMMQSNMIGLAASMITSVTDFLAIDPSTIIPDIPGLPGFNLIDLVNMDIAALIAVVSEPEYDFSSIPLIPADMFAGLNIPAWKALMAVQIAINGYSGNLAGVIFSLIELVTENLEIPGMDALPVLPTINGVLALLPAQPTIADLNGLSIPGFAFLLALPSPLTSSVNVPSYDLQQGLKNLFSGLNTEIITLLLDFIDTLPLGFTPPILCIDV